VLIWCASLAGAAEVSWMPEALEGSAQLRYGGRLERGGLTEGAVRVADRRVLEHRLDVNLQFAPIRGLAVTLGFAHVPSWSFSYPNARPMLVEPVDGGGSYLYGEPIDADPAVGVSGRGLEGIWLGAAVAPFSETYDKGHRTTWRLDLGVRPGAKGNTRWSATDGTRGAAPGGTAIRMIGAFSRRAGPADGYLRVAWQREGKAAVDVVDELGTAWVSGLAVQPASTVELLGGTEVVAITDDGARTAVDVHVGFGYRTWEDLPSGILLPNVIDAARTIPVTHSESVNGLAGLAVHVRFTHNVRVSLGGRFEYVLPHTQEHVYDVQTTADTFGASWTAGVTGVLGKDDVSGE
jgi:hypothetical protein